MFELEFELYAAPCFRKNDEKNDPVYIWVLVDYRGKIIWNKR